MTSAVKECPFRILVDTREQNPWRFTKIQGSKIHRGKPLNVQIQKATVRIGDYQIEGISTLAVERKSVDDFYKSIVHERENFIGRLINMSSGLKHAFIVVEGEWRDIREYVEIRTRGDFKSLHSTIIAWKLRYPTIQWHFCDSRRMAEVATFRIMEMFFHDLMRSHSITLRDITKHGDIFSAVKAKTESPLKG